MKERTLNALQVAALLVSASYGIGFPVRFRRDGLGPRDGRRALRRCHWCRDDRDGVHRRTVGRIGYLLDLFGQQSGNGTRRAVALLSLVWMAGVLAAQIQGGLALVGLAGMKAPSGFLLVVGLIYAASRLDLRRMSRVFSVCLAASAVALVAALIASDGASVYVSLPTRFYSDLSTIEPTRVVAIVIGVGVLVCMGADYHQFVLASRDARAAILGCVIAGIGLCIVAFLPPALRARGHRRKRRFATRRIPAGGPNALAAVAAGWVPGLAVGLLVMLSAAALGSGAAILRAMTSALESSVPSRCGHPALGLCALALGGAAASMGIGIIDTMVSVNVLYIASTGWVFFRLLRGGSRSNGCAAIPAMAVGFLGSSLVLVAGTLGLLTLNADMTALAVGVCASIAASYMPLMSSAKDQVLAAEDSSGFGSIVGTIRPVDAGSNRRRACSTTCAVMWRARGGSSPQ